MRWLLAFHSSGASSAAMFCTSDCTPMRSRPTSFAPAASGCWPELLAGLVSATPLPASSVSAKHHFAEQWQPVEPRTRPPANSRAPCHLLPRLVWRRSILKNCLPFLIIF